MSGRAAAAGLVLASESPARQALLRAAGLEFEVRPARVDEASIKEAARAEGASADAAALSLAQMKAYRIARADPDALVISADQILVCDNRWFDKPESVAQAREHLLALRGREHALVTAVLCQRGEQRLWHHVSRPRLWMRRFSDAFLDEYLAREGSGICASVGAYRLEAAGIQLFDRIEGEYAAILGLPLLPLLGFLRQHGALMA